MKHNYIDISNIIMPNGLNKIDINTVPDTYQIAISLFSQCNLSCKFCFQQNKLKIDKQLILTTLFKEFFNIINDINNYNIKNVNINVWGGQLFNDLYTDQQFLFYIFLIEQIKKQFINYPDINLNFNFISNGIFKNNIRVLKFLNTINGHIGFSYDPCNRYKNQQQLKMLKENINVFRNKLLALSLTLTKPNIEYLISNNDEIIDKNNIDINYYYPNKYWKQLMPSDQLLYQFFLWGCKNKKTNISIIKNIIQSYFNNYNHRGCNCKFSIQYINGQWTKNCVKRFSALNLQNFYGKYTKQLTQQNCTQIKNTLAILKRGCLYCQNYSKCLMLCFSIQIFKNYQINESFCPLKQIYNFIEKNEMNFK